MKLKNSGILAWLSEDEYGYRANDTCELIKRATGKILGAIVLLILAGLLGTVLVIATITQPKAVFSVAGIVVGFVVIAFGIPAWLDDSGKFRKAVEKVENHDLVRTIRDRTCIKIEWVSKHEIN